MIRRARQSDIEELVKLNRNLTTYHHGFDPYFKSGEEDEGVHRYLQAVLAGISSQIFVSEEAKKVTGYVVARIKKTNSCQTPETYGKLSQLYIESDNRNKGVGTALVKEAIQWFMAKGIENIELFVHEKNPEAIKLYKKLGFHDYQKVLRLDLE